MIKHLYNPAVFLVCFGLFFSVNYIFLTKNFRNSNDDIMVKITRGESLRSVATKLEQNNVVFNKYVLIALGKIFGYQNQVIPGQYSFGNGMSNMEVLRLITDPFVVKTIQITIPEGLTIRQMGRLLQRQIAIDSARFVEEAKNDSLIKLLGIEAGSLEGFLFPDTYRISFGGGNNERSLVSTMFNEFRKKVPPEMLEEAQKKKITLIELITMASIIEGETRFDPEKKIIAGVYYNRLKKGMRLEADPTVQYVLPDGPKKRLLYSDLKFKSPYNTYLNRGLPPGPINNPGLNSILAALNPEKHNYLYFAAKGDGSHRFAVNYEEHKKNARLYREYLDQLETEKGQ